MAPRLDAMPGGDVVAVDEKAAFAYQDAPPYTDEKDAAAPLADARAQILSPRDVEIRIAAGQTIVIFEDHVLKLDSWLDRHPGGKLAIQHMVGKDATDEIMA